MVKKTVIFLITLYQRILSPDQGILVGGAPVCRFSPSCSEYAKQAIIKYGLFGGVFRGLKRISHCHPFNPGGYDPLL